MAKFIGRQESVGIAKEATRGTLVAPSIIVPKVNYEVEDKVVKARSEGEYGVIAGGDAAFVGEKYAEGNLEYEIGDDSIGLFLLALFGTVSSSTFNSANKHTLSVNNSVQHQSLSLMVNDPIGEDASPNITLAYARAMINSLELRVSQGELARAIINFIAHHHKDYERQTFTPASENKFAHQHLNFYVDDTDADLDSASKVNIQDLTLRIEKNTIRENALGTVQPVDILNRKIMISGTISLTYEDRTYRDFMLNGTKKAVRILLNKKETTIGSTTPQIQIDLPIVDFHDWTPEKPVDDIASQEISFTALYDVSNTRLVGDDTFVVNETASY